MDEQQSIARQGVAKSGKPVDGTPSGTGSNGLLHVASLAEIQAAEARATEAEAKAQQALSSPPMKALEGYLAEVFEDARTFKEDETDTQSIMIDSLNRRNLKYDETKLQKIKSASSSDVFIGLTGIKCRAFESWVHDIYVNAKRKRTWDLKPTPVVEIQDTDKQRIISTVMETFETAQDQMDPKAAYEMASKMRAEIISQSYKLAGEKCDKMSRKIHDQFVEGGWIEAFSQGIMDVSTLKAMVMKGPIIRRRKKRTGWEQADGKTIPKIEEDTLPTFDRVSPLDLYPGRANTTVDDGPLCEKLNISRSSLVSNRNEPGYIKENIEHVAMQRPPAYNPQESNNTEQRDDAERRDTLTQAASTGPSLKAIEFWCRCPGNDLPEFGITKDLNGKDIDPFLDYDINAVTVSGLIVYLALNDDELGRRPYSVCGYAKEVGGFWYMGIPELIRNEQDIANAAARSMVNNLGIASGPQVIIPDTNRMPAGQNITSLHPWKIWQGTNMGNTTAPLVDFFQPDSRSAELLGVLNSAVKMTDSTLEMPSYSYGNDKVAGAGRTSSGLSMLMSSSSRGLKRIILDMDRKIFQTIVERMYDWNMINLKDNDIKGDMNFISEGVISMIMKEQLSDRRIALLQSTQNEFDMKILGMDGRAKILRDAIETLESDYDDIKPSEEKIARLIEEEQILQRQAIERNQMEIEKERAIIEREAAVAMEEVELERQKLMLEVQKSQASDKTMNRELDIRAAKNSQSLAEKIFEREDLEEENAAETK